MGSSRFRKLSKELEEIIFVKLSQILEEVIQEKVPDEEIAKGIIGKSPELRRPPIRERLLKLLQNYKLDQMRLKRSETTISSELDNILSRRNTYIHTGAVDLNQHTSDLYFLQELIELWLLRLLNCPDEAIASSAYRSILLKGYEIPDSFEDKLADLLSQED